MEFNLQHFANAGSTVNTTVGYASGDSGSVSDFSDSGTLAPEMKDFYNTELLENTKPRLIYSQFGKHCVLPANHKGTMEFRKWNTFDKASRLTEGVIPTGQTFGVTSVTGSVNQYGTYVSISDRLELRAYDDIIGGATSEMSASMARTMESLCRDALLTGTNVLYCDNVDLADGSIVSTPTACSGMMSGETVNSATASVGASTGISAAAVTADTFATKVGGLGGVYSFVYATTGTTWKLNGGAVTLADYGISVTGTAADGDCVTVSFSSAKVMSLLTPEMINKAVTILQKNNVPAIGNEYVAIVHPSVAHDLRNMEGWLELHKYAAPKQIFNGEIGSLHGVRFIQSPTAPVLGVAAASADDDDDYVNASRGRTYATYFLGSDAFAIIDPEGGGAEIIVHDKDEIGGPLNQFSTIGYKFETNGATILYPERVLRVMSCSTFSATDTVN